jgi:hypothetical protein
MHLNITYASPDEYKDVLANGIRIFVYPCGTTGTITSILNTAKLFVGSSADLIASNRAFLLGRKIFDTLDTWPTPPVAPDKTLIRSGDNIQVREREKRYARRVCVFGVTRERKREKKERERERESSPPYVTVYCVVCGYVYS